MQITSKIVLLRQFESLDLLMLVYLLHISAGISALCGVHFMEVQIKQYLKCLEAIREDGGDTKKYMAKAKDKNDPFRLMGFGHRVYKNFDPRAKIIKVAADRGIK